MNFIILTPFSTKARFVALDLASLIASAVGNVLTRRSALHWFTIRAAMFVTIYQYH